MADGGDGEECACGHGEDGEESTTGGFVVAAFFNEKDELIFYVRINEENMWKWNILFAWYVQISYLKIKVWFEIWLDLIQKSNYLKILIY